MTRPFPPSHLNYAGWLSHRICTVALFAFVAALNANSAQASIIFDFVQKDTDAILAKLELTTLPASATGDVVSFRFTQAGEDIFDLGAVYLGEFGLITEQLVSDGAGGLAGTGALDATLWQSVFPSAYRDEVRNFRFYATSAAGGDGLFLNREPLGSPLVSAKAIGALPQCLNRLVLRCGHASLVSVSCGGGGAAIRKPVTNQLCRPRRVFRSGVSRAVSVMRADSSS